MIRHLLAALLLLLALSHTALAETITMTFAGDCTIGCDVEWFDDERAFTNVIEQEGMDYPFALVRDVFAADDLTVVNLEGVLADTDEGIMSGRKYNFRGPTAYAQILSGASVELAVMGNNHTNDFGKPGQASTKAALEAVGVGWALNDDAYIFEKKGIRIGVLSYLSNYFSEREKRMPEIIASLKEEQGCAAVVVCIHAGVEYRQTHTSEQRHYARTAIRAGADLVIGHHPHVIQGMEIYENRNIAYSLGNFCFGGSRRIVSDQVQSMIVQVEMAFEDGKYAGQRMTILPAINTGAYERNNYQPYLAAGEEAAQVMRQIQHDTDYELAPFVEGEGSVQPWLMEE